MTWKLDSATAKGDVCEIAYAETTQDEDGNDVVESQTAKRFRTSFDGPPQADLQWHANIKRENAAGLSELHKVAPPPVNISEQVEE